MSTYNEQNNPNANYYKDMPASASSPTPGYVPAGTAPTTAPTGANPSGTPGNYTTNPVTGINEFSPSGGTPSPYYSRYSGTQNQQAAESYLDTFKAPETQEQIQERMSRDAQKSIDAVNALYDQRLQEQKQINEGRDRGTNSVNVLSGLSGSSEANVAVDRTNKVNQREVDTILAEKSVQIQGILSQIRTSAATEARSQRDDARASAESVLARRKATQEEAIANLTQLASAGTTLKGLKETDEAVYRHLVDSVGGEAMASAILFNGRPKDTLVGTPQLFGSQMFQAYQTPDGRIKYEAIPLPEGVDAAGIQSIEKTDNGIFIIRKDGTWATVTGSEKQKEDFTLSEGAARYDAEGNVIASRPKTATPSAPGDGFGGYSSKQTTALTKLNENVSKNASYSKTASMRTYADNVAASLSQKSGVGDIAAINQFQKVIDEGAVTRDQDVKLISSAQSLVSSLQTKIKKLERGDQLSQGQRDEIANLVSKIYEAQVTALSKDPYISAKKKEAEIYGLTLDDTILGELGGFSKAGGSKVLVSPDGTPMDATALTPEEYKEAVADGYTPQ